jgi:Tfp pilus assembly protein PilN
VAVEITLNLISPEKRRRHRLRRLGLLGLLVSLLLAGGNVYLHRLYREQQSQWEGRAASLREEIAKAGQSLTALQSRLSPKERERLVERVKLYNGIIQGAAFSWSRLLFELEQTLPTNIALVEIQPDFAANRITLTGEAKTMEDLLQCVRRLQERERFQQVYLLQHGVKRGQTGTTKVSFTISLRYRGEVI